MDASPRPETLRGRFEKAARAERRATPIRDSAAPQDVAALAASFDSGIAAAALRSCRSEHQRVRVALACAASADCPEALRPEYIEIAAERLLLAGAALATHCDFAPEPDGGADESRLALAEHQELARRLGTSRRDAGDATPPGLPLPPEVLDAKNLAAYLVRRQVFPRLTDTTVHTEISRAKARLGAGKRPDPENPWDALAAAQQVAGRLRGKWLREDVVAIADHFDPRLDPEQHAARKRPGETYDDWARRLLARRRATRAAGPSRRSGNATPSARPKR